MTVRVLGLKSGTTPEDHRLGLSLFMQPHGGALERRAGVVYYPASADLVSISAMQAKVTPFAAWVDGSSAGLQGGYPVVSDADVTLTFANGEAGVARIDRVIARVRDNPYDSSGSQAGSVEYLQGQSGGSATALPAGSLLLWEVTVPAGTTSGGGGINFSTARSDKRTFTSGLGGPIPVTNQAARDALTAYDHLLVWRMDTRTLEYYDGSTTSWKTYPSVTSSPANYSSECGFFQCAAVGPIATTVPSGSWPTIAPVVPASGKLLIGFTVEMNNIESTKILTCGIDFSSRPPGWTYQKYSNYMYNTSTGSGLTGWGRLVQSWTKIVSGLTPGAVTITPKYMWDGTVGKGELANAQLWAIQLP